MEWIRVISGLRHEVYENCAILGFYAMSSGNLLSVFRENLSVSSSRVKDSNRILFGSLTLYVVL
jgi:hypothetical protein